MASTRQSKPKTALRIWAALSLLLWVAASAFCALELVVGHAESGADHHSHAAAGLHQNGVKAQEKSGHSHDPGRGEDQNDSCCKSLKAVPPFARTLTFTKPDLGPALSLKFLWRERALPLLQAKTSFSRQPPASDRVFTPEVCLGPAFRSHAPPLFA